MVLLRDLLADDAPAMLVLVTIRSDAYEPLQTAKALESVTQQTLSLTPMPRGAYQAVSRARPRGSNTAIGRWSSSRR